MQRTLAEKIKYGFNIYWTCFFNWVWVCVHHMDPNKFQVHAWVCWFHTWSTWRPIQQYIIYTSTSNNYFGPWLWPGPFLNSGLQRVLNLDPRRVQFWDWMQPGPDPSLIHSYIPECAWAHNKRSLLIRCIIIIPFSVGNWSFCFYLSIFFYICMANLIVDAKAHSW